MTIVLKIKYLKYLFLSKTALKIIKYYFTEFYLNISSFLIVFSNCGN